MKRNLDQRLTALSDLLFSTAMELKALQYDRVDLSSKQLDLIKAAEDNVDTMGVAIKDIHKEVSQRFPKPTGLMRLLRS